MIDYPDVTVYRCVVCNEAVTESNFKWHRRPPDRSKTSPSAEYVRVEAALRSHLRRHHPSAIARRPALRRAIRTRTLTPLAPLPPPPPSLLSRRQEEVLCAAAAGETAAETAERLGLNYETIKTTRARAIHKLGARNMPHAVALALDGGWITMRKEPVR